MQDVARHTTCWLQYKLPVINKLCSHCHYIKVKLCREGKWCNPSQGLGTCADATQILYWYMCMEIWPIAQYMYL